MATLRVYGWTAFRPQCPTHHKQTREVVAARSKTEARRLNDNRIALSEIVENGNAGDIAKAMTEPGVVFWQPLDERFGRWARAGEPWPGLLRLADLEDRWPGTGSGVDIPLCSFEENLANFDFDFDPPYQRRHVWLPEQRSLFVGDVLRGSRVPPCFAADPGVVGNERWRLVDGKQRMTSLRMWLRGMIPADIGKGRLVFLRDTDQKLPLRRSVRVDFVRFKNMAEELRFYLRLNKGGTPHSVFDIARVEKLLAEEEAREARRS